MHVENDIYSLPHDLLQMLTGKLLGDGTITKQPNRIPRFSFSHSIKDRSYVLECYIKLSKYIPLAPPKFRRIYDDRLNLGYSDIYYVQSHKQNWFNELYQLWYPQGRKVIPRKLVDHSLGPLCLSWWYQDDGHLKIKNGVIKKILLSTENFTENDIEFLQSLIQTRFKIHFTIDSKRRLVLYDKPSIYYFLHIIRPYISKGMIRKDICFSKTSSVQFPAMKKVSIYLPSSVKLTHPTAQIRNALQLLPAINEQLTRSNYYRDFYLDFIAQLKNNNENKNSYQIHLNQRELWEIQRFQNMTGLLKSDAVYYCILELKKRPSTFDDHSYN